MTATREQIREAKDLEAVEKVPTPGWGDGHVYVRSLCGKERDAFDAMLMRGGKRGKINLDNARAKFAAIVTCDEHGKRIFTDADADWLGDKCARYLDRIFDVGGQLNGIREQDLEDSINFCESGQSDDSGTSSPDAGAAP